MCAQRVYLPDKDIFDNAQRSRGAAAERLDGGDGTDVEEFDYHLQGASDDTHGSPEAECTTLI